MTAQTRVVMGGMLTARQMGALIAWRRSHTLPHFSAAEVEFYDDATREGKRLLFARWLADRNGEHRNRVGID